MDTKKPENVHHFDVMSPYPSSMFENAPEAIKRRFVVIDVDSKPAPKTGFSRPFHVVEGAKK